MTTNFKSCPFCGAKFDDCFKFVNEGKATFFEQQVAVECLSCGAKGPVKTNFDGAQSGWNDRYGESSDVEAGEPSQPIETAVILRFLGVAMRARRKRAGLTMGDLAERLGVSVIDISDFERAKKPPSSPFLYKYDQALGDDALNDGKVFSDDPEGKTVEAADV